MIFWMLDGMFLECDSAQRLWSLASLGFQSCDAWFTGDKRTGMWGLNVETLEGGPKGREKHEGLAKDPASIGVVRHPRPRLFNCHM